jgi:chromosome segregation ATPase
LETPFKRVYDELNELQTQYNRLEHITREASVALGGCGPGNILREIAKKVDWKELDQVKNELDQVKKELEQAQTDNAHLHSQMAAMAEELRQKNEEVRKYHAEQAMVLTLDSGAYRPSR